jgi:CheY-like chemotaxis protein
VINQVDTERISSWRVLVVDDEPDSLEVVMHVLSHHEATVHTTTSGVEGLRIAREIVPTFILMDLSMPGMDGWEMLHNLKEDLRTAAIPVVAVTAHAMHGDRERALGAGFDYYLTKPISPFTFLEDLVRLFSAEPVRQVCSAAQTIGMLTYR